MKKTTASLLIASALLALPLAAHAAERAKAKVDCKEAGERYVYDCMIMLMGKKSGKPMDGAKIVIGADMPSMAMAHNVKPVTAMPAGKPGMYHARIKLEMHGEWALKMDVSGPTRDRIIHVMKFGGAMQHGSDGADKMDHAKEHGKDATHKHDTSHAHDAKHDSGMKHGSGDMPMKKAQ